MEDKQQGPYAFPLDPNITDPKFAGMTLRDYFAAKAMQGYLSTEHSGYSTYETHAEASYLAADAMLKQREL